MTFASRPWAGGQAALAALEDAYETHRGSLFRYLVSATRDAATAEDLAQEAFARLTREVGDGRPPRNPAAWLFRVALNLVTSRARHASVAERSGHRLERPDDEASPEDEVLRLERSSVLHRALAELPEDDRAALLLAARGYRGPEIAEALGKSQAATRTQLCRARARLRERLVAEGQGA